MGWIAKPSSAEDKLNRWMTPKNQLRIALWLSVYVCAQAIWSILEIVKPNWRLLTAIPAIFGVCALVASVYLKRIEHPSPVGWWLSVFLTLPAAFYFLAKMYEVFTSALL